MGSWTRHCCNIRCPQHPDMGMWAWFLCQCWNHNWRGDWLHYQYIWFKWWIFFNQQIWWFWNQPSVGSYMHFTWIWKVVGRFKQWNSYSKNTYNCMFRSISGKSNAFILFPGSADSSVGLLRKTSLAMDYSGPYQVVQDIVTAFNVRDFIILWLIN